MTDPEWHLINCKEIYREFLLTYPNKVWNLYKRKKKSLSDQKVLYTFRVYISFTFSELEVELFWCRVKKPLLSSVSYCWLLRDSKCTEASNKPESLRQEIQVWRRERDEHKYWAGLDKYGQPCPSSNLVICHSLVTTLLWSWNSCSLRLCSSCF